MQSNRRDFLKNSGRVATGLAVSFYLPGCSSGKKWGKPGDLETNAALRITPEGRVVFTLARVEMGQGTLTGETTIVAEELGLAPEEIEIEFAPAHPDFAVPGIGAQITGGSNSTRTSFPVLRKAGAQAREALRAAAAEKWGVSPDAVQLTGKRLIHSASKKSIGIGEVATAAQKHIRDDVPLKPKSAWKYIGKPRQRLDAASKTDGSAKFGMDFDPEGMEVAIVLRAPLGAKPIKIDKSSLEVLGVHAVVEIPSGVAIIADRYHQLLKARRQVKVEWSKGTFDTDTMWRQYEQAVEQGDMAAVRDEGDVSGVLEKATAKVSAEYRLPFLAHATMEPQCCTAWVRDDRVDVWAPTQAPGQFALTAARITGVSRTKCHIHQTLLGGGFGRRGEVDGLAEALELSMIRKKPVRVMFSREDDTQHDFYRPASLHRLEAVVEKGRPVAWDHRIVQQSVMARVLPFLAKEVAPAVMAPVVSWGMSTFADDVSIIEGAQDIPYGIENFRLRYHTAPSEVPVGFWRSVGHSSTGFVTESFIDELAHAAQKDPLEFRRAIMANSPQHRKVLDLVAEKSDWGKPLPKGRARGIAVVKSFESYVAEVAEVSIEEGRIRVHRVVVAADVGQMINPDIVKMQLESGVVFGLGAVLKAEAITYKGGRVQQSNFHDFQPLRMHESPQIDVHIVDSDAPPTGVGEPGTPPIAAAVSNAVFALTGQRLRSLPLRLPA
ncbi:MAG: molybdopterin cofactor-binding domain-containing protein [Myxococcota bacterium]